MNLVNKEAKIGEVGKSHEDNYSSTTKVVATPQASLTNMNDGVEQMSYNNKGISSNLDDENANSKDQTDFAAPSSCRTLPKLHIQLD